MHEVGMLEEHYMSPPLPVPLSEKKSISARVNGLLSSIGMQYLPNRNRISSFTVISCSHTIWHVFDPVIFRSLHAWQWRLSRSRIQQYLRLRIHGNREKWNPDCFQIPFHFQCRAVRANLTLIQGCRLAETTYLSRGPQNGCLDLIATISAVVQFLLSALTFFPLLPYITGFSVVLQTLWRMVVFPALARPMVRMRKRSHSSLCLRATYSSSSDRGLAVLEEEGNAGSDEEICMGWKGEVSLSITSESAALDPRFINLDRSERNIDGNLYKCDEIWVPPFCLWTLALPLRRRGNGERVVPIWTSNAVKAPGHSRWRIIYEERPQLSTTPPSAAHLRTRTGFRESITTWRWMAHRNGTARRCDDWGPPRLQDPCLVMEILEVSCISSGLKGEEEGGRSRLTRSTVVRLSSY